MCRAGTAMAGTKKDGRLYSYASNRFVGERVGKNGKFETKRFKGTVKMALREWQEWRLA